MRTLTIHNIEVPGEVANRIGVIVAKRLRRGVKEKEVAEFIALVLQEWAYKMDTLIEKEGRV